MARRSMAAQAEKLRTVPLLADLSQAALKRIAAMVTEFEARPGQLLIRPNTEPLGLFLIEEGSVVVEIRGGKTFELGPGEFFGELALLNPGAVRTARVRAKTDVLCVAIRREDFEKMLRSEPKVGLSMLRVLAKRLGDCDQELSRRGAAGPPA